MKSAAPKAHEPYPFEYAELVTSYLKHLTALSTGSIALQIAFLEKIFPRPKWKAFIVISLLSFTISIIASALSYVTVIALTGRAELSIERVKRTKQAGQRTLVTALLGFLSGVIAIVIFVLRNLFTLT